MVLPGLYGLAVVLSPDGTDPQPVSLLLRAVTLVGWSYAAAVAWRVRARGGADGRARPVAAAVQ